MWERSSAIILAGGRSRRMGQDKALLVHEGRTFLERTVTMLRALTQDIVVVADRPDRYSVSGARVIGDLFPDVGPVGGIVTGLNAVGPGAHFVVACDMPGVDVQVLTLLMEAVDPTLDAVVPELSGMPEPLCAVYCDSAEVKLRRFLADGGRSARGALDVLATLRIEEDRLRRLDPTARSLINVNTPEDLDRFREGITWRGNGA